MEGLVLFILAIAAIVLTLLLVRHSRHPSKPERIIVEPLGWLIDRWVWARCFGQAAKVAKLLALFRSVQVGGANPLDLLLNNLETEPGPAGKSAKQVTLLHRQPIGNLSEQRVIEQDGERISVLIGDVAELAPLLVSETKQRAGRGGVSLTECHRQAAMAAANGYLCLTVAATILHKKNGDYSRSSSHQLLGGVIIEPHLRARSIAVLQPAEERTVFLSVLPPALLAHLFAGIFPTASVSAVTAAEIDQLLTPPEHQAALVRHRIIGGANSKFRSQTMLFWQTQFNCSLISTNTEDAQMPVTAQQP